MRSVRKARAAGTFFTAIIILLVVAISAASWPAEETGRCPGMTDYNGYSLPDPPEYDTALYPYAMVIVILYDDGTFIGRYNYSATPFKEVSADGVVTNTSETIFWTVSSTDDPYEWEESEFSPLATGEMSYSLDYVQWHNEAFGEAMQDYNGHELPTLPTYAYDESKFPYATIMRRGEDTYQYVLIVSELPLVYDTSREAPPTLINDQLERAEYNIFFCYESSENWGSIVIEGAATSEYPAVDLGEYGEVIWCNYEMARIDRAAIRRRSYAMAYLTALCGPVIALPSKQPTAYSYNGVVLPELPEWDREMYPYAVICRHPVYATSYYLYLSATELQINENLNGRLSPCSGVRYLTSKGSAEWQYRGEYAIESGQTSGQLIWCKPNIYYDGNGALYMEASEPVPVYE